MNLSPCARRFWGLLLIAVLLLSAGCIDIRSRDTNGVKTIRYYTWAADPAEMVVIDKLIRRFEKTHPKYKVQHITSPGPTYYDKLMTMIAGGDPPDVVYLQPERFAEYVQRNALLNIQSYVNRDRPELQMNDYFKPSLDALTWKGDLYGLPAEAGPIVLYYNKDLFDQAGVPYPDNTWDWDTLVKAAKKLTKYDALGRITRYGVIPFDWQSFVWQNGGEILSPDRTRALMNTPAAVGGVKFFIDLYSKYHVSPMPSFVTGEETGKYFKSGKAAMYYCGRWYYTHLKESPNLHWDMSVIPHGKQKASLMIGLGWCIPRSSASPDAAWELLKFLSSKASLTEFAKLGYFVPPRKSVAESDAFLEPNSHYNNRAYIDTLAFAKPLPKTPVYARMMTIIQDEMTLAILKNKTVQQACDDMTRKVDRLLREEKESR